MNTKRPTGRPRRTAAATSGKESLNAMLRGFSEIVERLQQLAEKTGEAFLGTNPDKGNGNAQPQGAPTPGLNAVYGFSIKVGRGGDGGQGPKVRVEPFGNVRHDKHSGEAAVHEVREPMVDVFEESAGVRIVAEMPGVGAADVKVEITDDVLLLSAARGDKRYRKEIVLPRTAARGKVNVQCNNGVVEIWLKE